MFFLCTHRATTGNFGPGNLPNEEEAAYDTTADRSALQPSPESEGDEDDIPMSQLVKAQVSKTSAPPPLKKRKQGSENNDASEKENEPKMKFQFI